jgi:ankyrin repeat protein
MTSPSCKDLCSTVIKNHEYYPGLSTVAAAFKIPCGYIQGYGALGGFIVVGATTGYHKIVGEEEKAQECWDTSKKCLNICLDGFNMSHRSIFALVPFVGNAILYAVDHIGLEESSSIDRTNEVYERSITQRDEPKPRNHAKDNSEKISNQKAERKGRRESPENGSSTNNQEKTDVERKSERSSDQTESIIDSSSDGDEKECEEKESEEDFVTVETEKTLPLLDNPNLGRISLHHAAAHGLISEILFSIKKKKMNVNLLNKYGETPLHVAIRYGQAEVVRILLEHNADIRAQTENGFSPIALAVFGNQISCLNELLNFDPNLIRQKTPNMGSLLHIASLSRKGYALKYLLEKHKNSRLFVNDQNDRGLTPMMFAAKTGNLGAVAYLYKYGANLEALDNEGQTAMHWAVSANRPEVIKLLNYLEVNLGARSRTETTPYELAKELGLSEIEKLLLKYEKQRKQSENYYPGISQFLRSPEGLTFKGGGTKVLAYPKALKRLSKLLSEVQRTAGTSAGSIVAALFAVGCSPDRILKLMDQDHFKKMLKLRLGIGMKGLYDTKPLREWINKQIFKQTGIEDCTFRELHEAVQEGKPFRDLYVYAYCLSDPGYTARMSYEDSRFENVLICDAVGASCSIQLICEPVILRVKPLGGVPEELHQLGSFGDGGINYNDPGRAFNFMRYKNPGLSEEKGLEPCHNSRTLALSLHDPEELEVKARVPIAGLSKVASATYQALLKSQEQGHKLEGDHGRVISISNEGVGTFTRSPSAEEKAALFKAGEKAVKAYMGSAKIKKNRLRMALRQAEV